MTTELKITAWDSLLPWLPEKHQIDEKRYTYLITEDFLKSKGFGVTETGELNPFTTAFIATCMAEYGDTCEPRGHRKVYSLSATEEPDTYPDDGALGMRHGDRYYRILGEVVTRVFEDVFESSAPLDEYGKFFDGWIEDQFAVVRHDGKGRRSVSGNWRSFSQCRHVYLLSDTPYDAFDYSKDGIEGSVFGEFGRDEHGYKDAWDAFVQSYKDLLGFALFAWWFEKMTSEEEIGYRFRFDLARDVGSDIEDLSSDLADSAVLKALGYWWVDNTDLKKTTSLGWLSDVGEFGAKGNAYVEIVPAVTKALQRWQLSVVETIAETLRREENRFVVVNRGNLEVYHDNGRTKVDLTTRSVIEGRLRAGKDVRKDPILAAVSGVLETLAVAVAPENTWEANSMKSAQILVEKFKEPEE